MYHRYLFLAMGVRYRPQIGHVGSIGPQKEYLEVSQPHQGGRGQDVVPQVPLLGHGSEIETPNWACREFRPLKEILRLANITKVARSHQLSLLATTICYHCELGFCREADTST